MDAPLVNRVANSGLITLNLEDHYPTQEVKVFDLKDHLFHGLILKEKDFRVALKEHDWTQYQDSILLILCTADAIIPVWAYMLVISYAQPFVYDSYQGDLDQYLRHHYETFIATQDYAQYEGDKVIIKGCSQKPVPPAAYMALTAALKPYAQSVMYGEPCSTVPVFKRPRVLK